MRVRDRCLPLLPSSLPPLPFLHLSFPSLLPDLPPSLACLPFFLHSFFSLFLPSYMLFSNLTFFFHLLILYLYSRIYASIIFQYFDGQYCNSILKLGSLSTYYAKFSSHAAPFDLFKKPLVNGQIN